jgi:hypothetical protein
MAGADFSQQLFASGQMPGSLNATAAGDPDGKKPSVPLAAALGAKDANYWFKGFNTPGFQLFRAEGNVGSPLASLWAAKSGDRAIQAFQNTGSGNSTAGIGEPTGSGNYFQGMVASRGDAGERGV